MTDEGEDSIYLQSFGRRLAALRVQRGLSQEDLAAAAGLRTAEVRRIERGQRDLSVVLLADIARALQVLPGDLMPQGVSEASSAARADAVRSCQDRADTP